MGRDPSANARRWGEQAFRSTSVRAPLEDAREAFDRVSSLGGDLSGRIRHVGSRTFCRHGDGWVQAEVYDLGGEPELVRIQAFSTEYFALLTKHPQISGVLAIGDAVCFLPEGQVYLISTS